MKWITIPPRENWESLVESQGFIYHTPEQQYWVEDHAYQFDQNEILKIKTASEELQKLCLELVESVIQKRDFDRLAIPREFVPAILESWYAQDPSIYGRFDFSYDGKDSLKMLEFNADTPVTLLESSVIQAHWLEDHRTLLGEHSRQFNFIHEHLVQAWKNYALSAKLSPEDTVYFSCVTDSNEDLKNVEYMQDCARHAGIKTKFLFLENMGWNGKQFVDLSGAPILHCFKLYPWEILIHEQFGQQLIRRPMRFIEPAWKMILSNKAMLPMMWEKFEGHPNLLPTYFEPGPLGKSYVRKPIFSREGANITIVRENEVIETEGDYGYEGFIYQEYTPLPKFGESHVLIGSWIIGGKSSGICIRESSSMITDSYSRFVPHFFNHL